MEKFELTNKCVIMIASVLKSCVERNVEIDKISDLTYCLIKAGIEINSPLIKFVLGYVENARLEDGLWSTPLISAQNIRILGKNSQSFDKNIQVLESWMVADLWGQNTRDVPRLACSSEIIEALKVVSPDFINRKSRFIMQSVVKIWGRDIELVPYTFKAISFLYICAQLAEYISIGELIVERQLIEKTINSINASIDEDGTLPVIMETNKGNCSIHFLINLFKSLDYLEDIPNSIIQNLKHKLKRRFEKYIEKEIVPINHAELCDYCEIALIIDGL